MKPHTLKNVKLEDWMTILRCMKGQCTNKVKLSISLRKNCITQEPQKMQYREAWEPSATLQGSSTALPLKRFLSGNMPTLFRTVKDVVQVSQHLALLLCGAKNRGEQITSDAF